MATPAHISSNDRPNRSTCLAACHMLHNVIPWTNSAKLCDVRLGLDSTSSKNMF
jgi:hypothetical protein